MTSGRRGLGLLLILAALALVMLLSVAVGAKPIPVERVWDLVLHHDGSDDAAIVRELRVPRTAGRAAVGCALGLAGALMQAITRNPLADPGCSASTPAPRPRSWSRSRCSGVVQPLVYVWFAFAGAASPRSSSTARLAGAAAPRRCGWRSPAPRSAPR